MSKIDTPMNGAESLVHTLIKSGVDTCFANPGTSEMHFVAALDRIPGIRCVPGLQENVVTGMADGYGRIARKPAVTLLHCAAGLTNGVANLLNARKAQSPIVNVVGDQATYHGKFDPPLAADTEAFARATSHWSRVSYESSHVGRDGAAAVQAALSGAGQVATLVLPSDASWNSGGLVADALPVERPAMLDPSALDAIARTLREKKNVLLLIGASGLTEAGQRHAFRISQKTGCHIIASSINGLTQRGRGRLPLERIAYVADQAIDQLKNYDHIILAGTKGAVGFFAYPGKPSFHHAPHANVQVLARIDQDVVGSLEALADAVGAAPVAIPHLPKQTDIPQGVPSSEGFSRLLAAIMPEQAIVADESITFGPQFWTHSHAAAPHDWLMVTGGSIGYGMPCATGAAIAGKGRRVINPQADGSAMYTIQSLWTQAREKLPVTTIILNNRKYQILIGEYGNVGANPGPTAMNMLDLGNPDMDFVLMAKSMGVEAARTSTLEGCAALMQQSFKMDGPFLIELAT
jgi:acetolactate synthase I/II/III large subunit